MWQTIQLKLLTMYLKKKNEITYLAFIGNFIVSAVPVVKISKIATKIGALMYSVATVVVKIEKTNDNRCSSLYV